MSRMVLVIAAVVCIAGVGGVAALGLSGHAPAQQPVHHDIPLAAPQLAVQTPMAPPPPPPAPVVTPLTPVAPPVAAVPAPVTPAPAAQAH